MILPATSFCGTFSAGSSDSDIYFKTSLNIKTAFSLFSPSIRRILVVIISCVADTAQERSSIGADG